MIAATATFAVFKRQSSPTTVQVVTILTALPSESAHKTLQLASQDLEKAVQLGGRSAQIYADLGAVRDDLEAFSKCVTAPRRRYLPRLSVISKRASVIVPLKEFPDTSLLKNDVV